MSKALENWDANRADATDALVALVRSLIPEVPDKTRATEAIYAHVRDMRLVIEASVRRVGRGVRL